MKLRQKARTSLQTFRDGKGVPTSRYKARAPSTSSVDEDEENDELLMLGGKMRLVSKNQNSTAASSPILIEHSPTSMNPVVPLPLNQAGESSMHPNVVDYLRTFVPTPAPIPSANSSQLMPNAMNTVPMVIQSATSGLAVGSGALVGLPAQAHSHSVPSNAATTLQFQQPDPSLFDFTPVPNFATSVSYQPSQPQATQPMQQQQNALDLTFPQYFPVFDYSAGGMNGMGMEGFYTMDMNGVMSEEPRGHSSSATTPESMQGTWQEFVAQLGMT